MSLLIRRTLWKNAGKNLGKDISTEIKYEFKVSLPPKLKRSSDRFSKLFIFTMNQILEKKKGTY